MSDDNTGDRIKEYMEQAERDDAARRAELKDTGLPHATRLNEAAIDALASAVAAATGKPAVEHQKLYQISTDIAVSRWRSRAIAKGLTTRWVHEQADIGLASVAKAMELCESPIERQLVPWLVFGAWGFLEPVPPLPVFDCRKDIVSRHGLFIAPQLVFGRYRIDIAIIRRNASGSTIIAVECDGADFHNNATDILRDGYLASFGIRTLRFPGSEIYARADHVSEQIINAFMEAQP